MTYYQVPKRSEIKIGSRVKIAEKKNYANGVITEGTVNAILTSKEDHPRGVKVRLTNGIIGRVQALGAEDPKPLSNNDNLNLPQTKIDYIPSEDELI